MDAALTLAAQRLQVGRENRYPAPGDLAAHLDPRTVHTPALGLLDRCLLRVADGRLDRLIWTMAPQEGKSQRISRTFPLWLLLRNPDTRIAIVSYESEVARRWGRSIRNDILGHPELGLSIRHDTAAAHEWQLDGHLGGVVTVGIGGALTGRPVDCVSADTLIECEYGQIRADEAFARRVSRILAYDHATGLPVWRDVEASRRIPGRRVLEVTTAAGRTITCTPDHRVYTRRGYVPARDLRPGDTLLALVADRAVPMRQPPGSPEDGDPQGDPPRPSALLHAQVHGRDVLRGEPHPVLRLRRTHSAQPQIDVLERVRRPSAGATPTPDANQSRHSRDEKLPAVLRRVPAEDEAHDVLLADVREPGALTTHDRHGEFALQNGHELRPLVPLHASFDPSARWHPLRRLLRLADTDLSASRQNRAALRAGGPPHRRGRHAQPAREPDHALYELPHRAPQVAEDTVAVVRDRGEETVAVYDFQVEGTRNFFGGGLLVHNCLIIDDPVKGRAEADSPTYREQAWSWWTETGATRLGRGACVVLLMTRWHEDDLAGRLLASESASEWTHINIPALADHAPENGETDPLGRDPGEWMVSARRRTVSDWQRIRRQVGSRAFTALYQGRPSPGEGGVFKRDWWQWYDTPRAVPQPNGTWRALGVTTVIASWDLSFKDTAGTDYVCGQVWGVHGADAFLLDQTWDRLDFPATCLAVEAQKAKWPQIGAILVEDKANGPAVLSQLRRKVPGLIPVSPVDSKLARAHAVSPFVQAGNIHLPTPVLAPWIGDWLEEVSAFPLAAHDDRVDAMTQALHRLYIEAVSDAGDYMRELVGTRG